MLVNSRIFVCIFVWIGVFAFGAHATEPVSIEAFTKYGWTSKPRLSPDGQYLAVSNDLGEGNHALVVYRIADMQLTAMLKLPRYQLPLQVAWVSNNRLVIAKGSQSGSRDRPRFLGEIIASDFDGKNQTYLYGYEQANNRGRGLSRGFGFIEDLPEIPNGHFYMRALSQSSKRSSLYDMDTVNGAYHLVADIDKPDLTFVLDQQEKVRYAWGSDENANYLLFESKGALGKWEPIPLARTGGEFRPFSFTPDNQRVYAWLSKEGGPYALVVANPDATGQTVIASDAFANVDNVEWTVAPAQPFAVTTGAGIPVTRYLDENSPDARLHKSLRLSFPGKEVTYVDQTLQGDLSLVLIDGDRDPGAWYLFDRKHKKMSKLLDSQPGIDPSRMGERRPFRFKASDGTELTGFMTLPAGIAQPRNLPMVLLPHGGPHGVADEWSYDNDAQFLASRGYLVLQTNFRCSGGRGMGFETAGYLKWGTRIQDDLLDSVHWAIDQGYADQQKICVYGVSFGGYSAMMTAARAPGLFKCAVGFAGVYDLKLMYTKGDINDTEVGRNYLQRAIGSDDALLRANSPTSLAAQIKVPVLLVHGSDDQRAPIAHARAMRAALEKAGHPPEWMEVSKEGHGFYKEENNMIFYQRLETFLRRYIGPDPH